jgi:putative transposase
MTQKQMIKKWFGTHRYVYNDFLSFTKSNTNTKEWMNFYGMRNKYVIYNNGKNEYFKDKQWMIETPKDIRADAIKSCISAHKSCFTNLRNKNVKHFSVNYKSKKQNTYAITIPKSAIKYEDDGFFIYKTYMNSKISVGKRTMKKFKNQNINHDTKLITDGVHYYMLLPMDTQIRKPINNDKSVIALDPGVRTFQTGYSDTEVVEFSSRTNTITKIQNKLQLLQSLRDKKIVKVKKKKILKLYLRIKNIVNDIHWKTITYIKNNYTDVLLPSFESQDMVTNTFLHSTTKRQLLGLQHYKFKEKLLNKKEINVHVVNEAFTSKTCGCCGEINYKLGSSKMFKCSNCNLTIDRDFNGARNIYLKYMGERTNTLNESK